MITPDDRGVSAIAYLLLPLAFTLGGAVGLIAGFVLRGLV